VCAESFINYNYEEVNKIADPYWVYPDVVSSSDAEDEEVPPAGAAAAGSSSEDSNSGSGSDSGSDSDDDMTVGQLRAGSDATSPSSEP
jgi:hypothetical protein